MMSMNDMKNKAGQKEIPVYLFSGFLDSGKTTFIQGTLEDPAFQNGEERTLVLLCEEGEEELHPAKFAVIYGVMTSWAIRSSGSMVWGWVPWLWMATISSPR